MEPNSINNPLPMLNLNSPCKHVLQKFYPEIAQGRNRMDDEQIKSGKYPYVKMGITDPENTEKVWVKMQIFPADSTYKQTANNVSGSCYNGLSYIFNAQVTNVDYTHKALESARNVLNEEFPRKYTEWKNEVHTEDETKQMITHLSELQDVILTVSTVVSCVIRTYMENVNLMVQDKENLVTFAKYLQEEIAELTDRLEKSQEKSPVPKHAELDFKTEDQANKWYQRKSSLAVKMSTVKEFATQVQSDKDIKKMYQFKQSETLFDKFANGVDLAFQKNRRNEEVVKEYIKDVNAKMLKLGVSQNLIPLLGETETFSFLLKAIAQYGQESDFRLFFEVLLNGSKTGPSDLTNAPIVLNEIFNNLAYFNLFKA